MCVTSVAWGFPIWERWKIVSASTDRGDPLALTAVSLDGSGGHVDSCCGQPTTVQPEPAADGQVGEFWARLTRNHGLEDSGTHYEDLANIDMSPTQPVSWRLEVQPADEMLT